MASGEQFHIDVRKWVEEKQADMNTIRQKVVLDLGTDVIIATPVDTGYAQGSWQTTLGQAAGNDTDRKGADVAIGELKFISSISSLAEDIWLINRAPYIHRLESGNSTQAPSGMVKTNIGRYPYIVKASADEEGWS